MKKSHAPVEHVGGPYDGETRAMCGAKSPIFAKYNEKITCLRCAEINADWPDDGDDQGCDLCGMGWMCSCYGQFGSRF